MFLRTLLLAILSLGLAAALPNTPSLLVSTQPYTWKHVKIGGGGGFVPGIVFNPSQQGLAYARTDIGGVYRLNVDDSWTFLLDWVDNSHWDYWSADAVASDPVDPQRLYIVGCFSRAGALRADALQAAGMYTNSWDPSNGTILISTNQGETFAESPLPFKVGGNMPGRGVGEVYPF